MRRGPTALCSSSWQGSEKGANLWLRGETEKPTRLIRVDHMRQEDERKSAKLMPPGAEASSDCPHAGSMQRALMQFSTTSVLHARIKPRTVRGQNPKSAYHAPPYKFQDPMSCTEPAAESPLQAHGRSVMPSEPGESAHREHLEKSCLFNSSPLSPQISQCLQTQDHELPIE